MFPGKDQVRGGAGIWPIKSLAHYYLATDHLLAAAYRESIEEAYGRVGADIVDPALQFAHDGAEFNTFEDDFVGSFRKFLADGIGFRQRINYARVRGFQAEAELLQAKYSSFRRWLGFDVSVDGKEKELFEYRVGDIVRIEDYEPELPGILLSRQPRVRISPSHLMVGSVWDGDEVELVGGPFLALHEDTREAVKIWKVAGGRMIRPEEEREGFMSQEWFGQPVR